VEIGKWALKSETNMRLLIYSELLLFFLAIFLPAGRLDYWQGWLFIAVQAVLFGYVAKGIWKMKGMVKERLSPGAGMKGWDKVIFLIVVPVTMAIFPISALDAGRFGWSPALPWWLYAAAYALMIAGEAWMIWAMEVNRYFSSVVRIQNDRKQKVVQDGPYAVMRHPGYAGGMLFIACSGVALGSVYALIPAAISIAAFAIRTYLEDETLKSELKGYREYARKVRHRLVPGIW
jgi:protein-S-isoprenylcysteine O-methyltransferase Ste14